MEEDFGNRNLQRKVLRPGARRSARSAGRKRRWHTKKSHRRAGPKDIILFSYSAYTVGPGEESTNIPHSPTPEDGSSTSNDEAESVRREKILQLRNQIWQLENSENLRWLFITNDDLDLHCEKARRRLLWQLTSRFDVGRGLSFDEEKERMCWDATTPIPSSEHGVRR